MRLGLCSWCCRQSATLCEHAGKPVNTLYVAKKMMIAREMYFAILLDRSTSGPIMIGCSEGGTSIEDLAEKFPEKIIKIPVDINQGITDDQASQMAKGLGVHTHMDDAKEQIKALYKMFVEKDCTMVEVCPLPSTMLLPAMTLSYANKQQVPLQSTRRRPLLLLVTAATTFISITTSCCQLSFAAQPHIPRVRIASMSMHRTCVGSDETTGPAGGSRASYPFLRFRALLVIKAL